MIEAWPDDVQVSQRRSRIDRALDRGWAICPQCLTVHSRTGQEHRHRPWSITPRCLVDGCGQEFALPLPYFYGRVLREE